MFRVKGGDVVGQYLGLREAGLCPRTPGLNDLVYKRLYSSFDQNRSDDDKFFIYSDYSGTKTIPNVGPTGAIFNLAFSPDGSILGAATERKSVLLFDPFTRKLVNSVENAHSDSVNCIRFLDTRLFATCSDDTNVALWDARYLKTRLRTLSGHSNWVKNIEFSYKENCLVTSGFDGAIYLWDINRYSEREGPECTKAFYNNGLMRMKITPDGSRMVISTTNAYIMIIHDLCLETLAEDLMNFKPNVYRIMQISGEPMPTAFNFTHLFHAKRNRVEFISDFAPSNDAEVISSLQLHPQGWVAVSRNISSDEQSEWCCVHDIQSYPVSKTDDTFFEEQPGASSSSASASTSTQNRRTQRPSSAASSTGFATLAAFMRSFQDERITPRPIQAPALAAGAAPAPRAEGEANQPARANNPPASDISALMEFLQARTQRANAAPRHQSFLDLGDDSSDDDDDDGAGGGDGAGEDDDDDEPVRGFLIIAPGHAQGPRIIHLGNRPKRSRRNAEIPVDASVHHNSARLTHYLEESNHCKGYIKEISFSPDGRILASPFAHSIRLLSFDEQVRDLSDCPPKYPSENPSTLHEVGLLTKCHNDAVLSTAFSPFHFILVSGCMGGKIVWHQPVF